MNEEITDDEAIWWLNNRCLSFRVGNECGHFIGSWNNLDGDIIKTAKQAMLRITPRDVEEE